MNKSGYTPTTKKQCLINQFNCSNNQSTIKE